MGNYFVTVHGFTRKSNLSRDAAIKMAKSILDKDKTLGTLNVGIGEVKTIKGKQKFTLLPCHFFFD